MKMKRIAIHSVPRSGSTWLGSIFDSHPAVIYKFQPLFSYALKGYLSPESDLERILSFYQELENTRDDFMDQADAKSRGIVPDFAKSSPHTIVYKEVRYHHIIENLLIRDKDIKIIGLVRNPLSTLASWLKAPREFRSDLGWDFEKEWLDAPSKNQNRPEEFYGFNKWMDVTLLFERLSRSHPHNFYLIRYESLLTNTLDEVRNLFKFAGLEFTEQTETFINASKARHTTDSYGVYKKKTGRDDWKNSLPQQIIETVQAELEKAGLESYLS